MSPQDTRVLKFSDARIVVSSETEDVVITYETEGYEYRVTYDIVDRYEDERGIPE